MRYVVVAAPNFVGRNENYISTHVFQQIRKKKFWIEGDYPMAPPCPVYYGTFYDDDIWMRYQVSTLQKLLDFLWKDGDVVFFCDFWFPGLDILKYYLDVALKKKVKFVGYLHGASWVAGDIVTALPWVPDQEKSWLNIYDKICAASNFFVANIPEPYRKKVILCGEPFDYRDYKRYASKEKPIDVIFPHRFDPDKGIDEFIRIAEGLNKWSGGKLNIVATSACHPNPKVMKQMQKVCTVVVGESGDNHCLRLGRSKIVLSTAIQEGWGYSILKAVSVGCIPVLPCRAVYPELYPKEFLYQSELEAVAMVARTIAGGYQLKHPFKPSFKVQIDKLV